MGLTPALSYTDGVNIVGENIDAIKKNRSCIRCSKEVGLEVNPEKAKYTLMSHDQKIGQKHSIERANRSFEDVVKLKYLGITLIDQNYVHKGIRRKLISGNSVQSLLSSFLLSRNVKDKYKNHNSASYFVWV
jgi:hypothetical protein